MVKIYSTDWCPWCVKAKKYFDSKNIEFTELIVADDKENREEVFKVSGQRSVPVIDINGEIVVGFDREKIDKVLNL
ncbi:Glutaredoxin-3 [compost metagenome]|jgi:glutaredoxin-like YruB-family protein|uniref:Glutaredoxin-like protein, YruB-family n=1 Tax=Clostridium intestinale DSM 6191 TaxID=1121320 RepID=A0A1M6EVS0_9CLOT|nr:MULTISPECIES: glutaredoxin family protein [Clostridium]WRY50203.1 glutaredoxin family protein [Clostridium intestinale]SHI89516.1 Glutaredoxin-like protein, YruB-family [Clostridium intestinale DSM 6191]